MPWEYSGDHFLPSVLAISQCTEIEAKVWPSRSEAVWGQQRKLPFSPPAPPCTEHSQVAHSEGTVRPLLCPWSALPLPGPPVSTMSHMTSLL